MLAASPASGLIAYAGSAHLVLPPTTDGTVVTTMASALAPDVMPRQGDALLRPELCAEAIRLAPSYERRHARSRRASEMPAPASVRIGPAERAFTLIF